MRIALYLAVFFFGCAGMLRAEEDGQQQKYLVVLDFESKFDKGKLGRKVGQMFRAKSVRRKLFSVDAEIDWPDLSAEMKTPAADAKPDAIAAKARDIYNCDVLVWGRLTKPGKKGTARDILTKQKSHTTSARSAEELLTNFEVFAIDLKKDPKTLAVNKKFELENEYAISPSVDIVLKMLTGVATPADIKAAHVSNRMEPVGENLCVWGNMAPPCEDGQDWHKSFTNWHFPMKEGIEWIHGENPHLKYTLTKEVAASTGLFCYTPFLEIKPDTYYQVSFRVKTTGSKVIMFVKGYRDMEFKGYENVKTHRQEVFKHQIRFYGEKNEWGVLKTKPFLPRSAKPQHMPTHIRVQLYAYWPKGQVWFDDVEIHECKEIKDK